MSDLLFETLRDEDTRVLKTLEFSKRNPLFFGRVTEAGPPPTCRGQGLVVGPARVPWKEAL